MRKCFWLLALLAACESPTDPLTRSGLPRSTAEAIVGTWNLTAWNGKAIPALYATYFGTDAVADSVDRIGGGSITLNDDATYTRTTLWQIARMDGTLERESVRTEQGSYTGSVAGGFITLNLFGPVRMQIAINGNAMSAKYLVDQPPPSPPILLGDVWRYEK